MQLLGLKSHITGTLIFLLTLGVICSDVVIIMFWQRGLIEAEIRHARSYLMLWGSMRSEKNIQNTRVQVDLDSLCTVADTACVGASFFDGRDMITTAKSKDALQLAHVVRQAALSGHDVIRFSGSSWGVFTFSDRHLLIAVPITDKTNTSAGLGMMIELQPVYLIIKGKKEIIFWYMLVNVLFLTIIGFFRLQRSIVRPLERLVKISETYSGEIGQVFFLKNKGGEFGQLTLALNSLISRVEEDRKKLQGTVDSLEIANMQLIKTRNEMVRTEKFAAIGRLSAGLAHEIGNPIGIVQGYLELLRQPDILDEERRQFSSRAIAELERISRLIHQLLDFSRSFTGKPEPVDIQGLLDSLIEMVSAQQEMSSISFVKKYMGGDVLANPDGLKQVFLNCLLNATDAVKEKGNQDTAEIVVACREEISGEDAPVVRISIMDNGRGIKKEDMEKIFDPFFTTKEPGHGTGLGLSVSYSIIEAAGGRIWVESEEGIGTTVNIEIPGKA